MPWWAILLIILAVVAVIMIVLYKLGDNLQKKQLSQKQQMIDAAQQQTMMIIDKKMLPMKDANLPKIVMEQTPKRYQKAKMPIVKAKIGPQIMNFICDDAIFDELPTKCEVKAMVSGIYILSVKSTRGKKAAQANVEEEGKKQKKSLRTRMARKQAEYQRQLNDELLARKQNEEKGIKKKSKADIKKEQEKAKKITDGIK